MFTSSNVKEYFNSDKNVVTRSSTLLNACHNNNYEQIKYLIKNFNVNMEKLVSLGQFEDLDNISYFTLLCPKAQDGKKCQPLLGVMAPVLWHACRSFDFKVVKLLVELGASVNSKAESSLNSTPLMVACARNRFDVAKYLIEDGHADINATDINGDNCLTYAIRHNEESLRLVRYLVVKNVNIAKINSLGRISLDYSVFLDNPAIMEFLLEEIARKKIYNINYDFSIMFASLNSDCEKLKHIYVHPFTTDKTVKVDALECIGVMLASDKDLVESALMYWDASIDERNVSKIPKFNLRKEESFLTEFSLKKELNLIAADLIDYQMQSLWIRETILKKYKFASSFASFNLFRFLHLKRLDFLKAATSNNTTYTYLTKNFKKLVKLWTFTLELHIAYLTPLDPSTIENIFDFINYLKYVAGQCLQKYPEIYASIWLKLLKICLYEITRASTEVKSSKIDKNLHVFLKNKINCLLGSLYKVDYKNLFENIEIDRVEKNLYYEDINHEDLEMINANMDSIYKLIHYLADFSFANPTTLQTNAEFKDLLRRVIYANNKFVRNNSLKFLSMSIKPRLINTELKLENKFLSLLSPFNFKLVQHLLESGADADCLIDDHSSNNTFLNEGLFRSEATGLKKKNEFDSIIELFMKHGAHLDFSNDNSLTLQDLYHCQFDNSICNLVKPFRFVSLKCLATKKIIQNQINYQSANLPTELVSFVKRHQ